MSNKIKRKGTIKPPVPVPYETSNTFSFPLSICMFTMSNPKSPLRSPICRLCYKDRIIGSTKKICGHWWFIYVQRKYGDLCTLSMVVYVVFR